MRATVRTALGLLAIAGALLAPSTAGAAAGQLSYDRCFANDDGVAGCTALPGAPLTGAGGVAVSPDGRSVYVTSQGSASVAHFPRTGPAGEISYDRCVAANGAAVGCEDLPSDFLGGAEGVTVSPDGTSVYVASGASHSVAHFRRSGDGGSLAYGGCWANTTLHGCGALTGTPLNGARAAAVSPDGRSIYVASRGRSSVSHLLRSETDGQLTFDACQASGAAPGCADLDGAPLDGAGAVALSPDGKSVYVVSESSSSIAHFLRNGPQGQLTYAGCQSSGPVEGCLNLPLAPIAGASAVAVSPDGGSVYVAAPGVNAVARFARDSAGHLSFEGCVSGFGESDCVDLPGGPISSPNAITVSPDGSSVYVTSPGAEAVTHLVRSAGDGSLTFGDCLSSSDAMDLGCARLPGKPLRNASAVAASPDGSSVYVASAGSNSVAHFFRERGTNAPAGDQPPDSVPADTVAPRISRLGVTRRRLRVRTAFRYSLSESASVSVAIERCRKPRRRERGCARWMTVGRLVRAGDAGPNRLRLTRRVAGRRLRPGAYRASFVATDPSGNRSPSARAGFQVVPNPKERKKS